MMNIKNTNSLIEHQQEINEPNDDINDIMGDNNMDIHMEDSSHNSEVLDNGVSVANNTPKEYDWLEKSF